MKVGISICIWIVLLVSCSHSINVVTDGGDIYFNGNISGNICNVNYIIKNQSEYKIYTISCGHGVEAYGYQTKNNGYYFVSCNNNFDITKFEPDTMIQYRNTKISIGRIKNNIRIMREWQSGLCVVHCFLDETNTMEHLNYIKNIKVY